MYLSHDTPREAYVRFVKFSSNWLEFFFRKFNTSFASNNTVLRLDAQAFQPRQREALAKHFSQTCYMLGKEGVDLSLSVENSEQYK